MDDQKARAAYYPDEPPTPMTVISIQVPVGREHNILDQIADAAFDIAIDWNIDIAMSSETTLPPVVG
jgi:hypothetical protein